MSPVNGDSRTFQRSKMFPETALDDEDNMSTEQEYHGFNQHLSNYILI